MHTISSLRKTLGLSTTNQVRNRIDAIRDVLSEDLRRGPNNQILISDMGADFLRQLQDLYDSGLTMAEASDVVRSNAFKNEHMPNAVSSRLMERDTKPDDTQHLVAALRSEISFLRARLSLLEDQLSAALSRAPTSAPSSWWESLKGDVDAS
jgi:hypothetical protein